MIPKITSLKLNSKSFSWARMYKDLLPNCRICLIRLKRVILTTNGQEGGKVRFQIGKRKIVWTKIMGQRSNWTQQTDLLKVIRIKLIRYKKGVSEAKTRKANSLRLNSSMNLSRCLKWIGHLSKVRRRGAENINLHRLTWIYPSLPLTPKTSTAMQLTYRSISK